MTLCNISRFVAGSQFYNYELYGGLRSGGTTTIFSQRYCGLVASAFASAFIYISLRSGLLPMLSELFQFSPVQENAIDRFLEFPAAFAFVVGVISDSQLICRYRRKSYMIIGLIISSISLAVIAFTWAINNNMEHKIGHDTLVYITLLSLSFVSVGSMVTFVSVHTMVVTVSQQESLHRRGAIQAEYLIVRVFGQVLARILVFVLGFIITDAHVPSILMVLVLVCVGTVWFNVRLLREPIDLSRAPLLYSIKLTGYECRRLTQQKAVYRTLGFVAIFTLCMGFKFPAAQRAIRVWSEVDNDTMMLLMSNVVSDCVSLVAALIWVFFFKNNLWRTVFGVPPLVLAASQGCLSMLTTFNVLRHPIFYIICSGFSGIVNAGLALSTLVPVTEIVHQGAEGSLVGLAISCTSLFKIFVSTLMDIVDREHFISTEAVVLDTGLVRSKVCIAHVITFMVNLMAFLGVWCLPVQKLDAQQLRTFGGFTLYASTITSIMFTVLMAYCIAYNMIHFISSMQTSN